MVAVHVASFLISLSSLMAEYTPQHKTVPPSNFGFVAGDDCSSLTQMKIGPESEGAVLLSLEDILSKADALGGVDGEEELFVHLLENPNDPDEISWQVYTESGLTEKEVLLNKDDPYNMGYRLQ